LNIDVKGLVPGTEVSATANLIMGLWFVTIPISVFLWQMGMLERMKERGMRGNLDTKVSSLSSLAFAVLSCERVK